VIDLELSSDDAINQDTLKLSMTKTNKLTQKCDDLFSIKGGARDYGLKRDALTN